MPRDFLPPPANSSTIQDLAHEYFEFAAVNAMAKKLVNRLSSEEQEMREKMLFDGSHWDEKLVLLKEARAAAEESAKPHGLEFVMGKVFRFMGIGNAEGQWQSALGGERIARHDAAMAKIKEIEAYFKEARPRQEKAVWDVYLASDALDETPDSDAQMKFIALRDQYLSAGNKMQEARRGIVDLLCYSGSDSAEVSSLGKLLAANRPPFIKQELRMLWAEAAADRLLIDTYSASKDASWRGTDGDPIFMQLQNAQQQTLSAYADAKSLDDAMSNTLRGIDRAAAPEKGFEL